MSEVQLNWLLTSLCSWNRPTLPSIKPPHLITFIKFKTNSITVQSKILLYGWHI